MSIHKKKTSCLSSSFLRLHLNEGKAKIKRILKTVSSFQKISSIYTECDPILTFNIWVFRILIIRQLMSIFWFGKIRERKSKIMLFRMQNGCTFHIHITENACHLLTQIGINAHLKSLLIKSKIIISIWSDIFHLYVNSKCRIFLGFCCRKAFNSKVNRGENPSLFESVKSILQLKLFCGQTSVWEMNEKISMNDDYILIHIEKLFPKISIHFYAWNSSNFECFDEMLNLSE